MSREIKKYVRYYLQSRKKWQNDRVQRPHPIVLSFHYNSKVLCTLTGLKMLETDWDKARQRAKPSVKRSKVQNPVKLTTLDRFKLTTPDRLKLTIVDRSKLTT